VKVLSYDQIVIPVKVAMTNQYKINCKSAVIFEIWAR